MTCKKCGKDIDDKSKFCEYCGAKLRQKKKMTKSKKIVAAFGSVLLVIVLLIGYFGYAPIYFGNHYYGHADCVIEDMSYDGKQFIENIEFDKNSKTIKFIFSDNNFDTSIDESLVVGYYGFSSEENYLAYDYNTNGYCFEYVNRNIGEIVHLDENSSHFSEYIIYDYNKDFEQDKIYAFHLDLYLEPNTDYGNPVRKLLLKTLKNPYISGYIYRGRFNVGATYEHFDTTSYFIYDNGTFKPLFLDDNLDDYVNAVWDGTDLNVIKYDENGEVYLEGPIRTRETVQINN